MPLICVDNMRELGADGITVGELQCLVDFTQRGIRLPYMHAAGLEHGIEIRRGKLMKTQIEVGNMLPHSQTEGVQI